MGAEKSVSFPFQLISLDIMGPFPRSRKGNTQLLVVCDWFTKFVLVQPLAKATAGSVIKFLENQVFLLFGVPQIIMCDNDSQFTSKEFKDLLKEYKVKHLWYNPTNTNAMCQQWQHMPLPEPSVLCHCWHMLVDQHQNVRPAGCRPPVSLPSHQIMGSHWQAEGKLMAYCYTPAVDIKQLCSCSPELCQQFLLM